MPIFSTVPCSQLCLVSLNPEPLGLTSPPSSTAGEAVVWKWRSPGGLTTPQTEAPPRTPPIFCPTHLHLQGYSIWGPATKNPPAASYSADLPSQFKFRPFNSSKSITTNFFTDSKIFLASVLCSAPLLFSLSLWMFVFSVVMSLLSF